MNYAYQLFAKPTEWITILLEDILSAKRYIYVEMYRIHNDETGYKVCQALAQKAQEGVEVKVLVDSWGSSVLNPGFKEIQKHGGEVIFFKKIVITFNWFAKNHERNHRKLICIDDEISHLGSANISVYSLHWRESVLRIQGEICKTFKKLIVENIKVNSAKIRLPSYYKRIKKDGFTIIRETPSIQFQKTKSFFEQLIHQAKHEITIITPYFLPGLFIRNALYKAAKRGVAVTIIMPAQSDVKAADYIRDLYLNHFHNKQIKLQFYRPDNIHAKVLLIDNQVYTLGSSNFDYRSFRYMYELTISGHQVEIIKLLETFIRETYMGCIDFEEYNKRKRPWYFYLYAALLLPFRRLL
jgi:cardiolipin synthase